MTQPARHVDTEERRARLGRRHHLDRPAADLVQVARSLTGLHSSDPTTVHLSARARLAGAHGDRAAIEHVLYDERALLRTHGMRRTMFVVDPGFAVDMHSATTVKYLPNEIRKLGSMIEDHGVTDDGVAFIGAVIDGVVRFLDDEGPQPASEITKAVPRLATKLTVNRGKAYQGTMSIGTKVLFIAATEGRIARGRPQGTWLGSQYRWHLFHDFAGFELEPIDPAEARAAIIAAWLATYGPGTLTDLTWWSGLGKRDITAALAAVGAVEVLLDDGATGFLLPDDLDPVEAPDHWVRLLPSLDQAVMGWKEREWFLGDLGSTLFDRNGNSGQVIMCDGRIVGGWGQRRSGPIVTELMVDVPASVERRVADEVEALQDWLGDSVVTPRFASPFDKAAAKS